MNTSQNSASGPRPDLDRVVAHIRQLVADPPEKGLLAWNRAAMNRYAWLEGKPPPLPAGVTVTPATVDGLPGEWLTTANSDPNRRLLYLHGGAWLAGSAAAYRHLTAQLSLLTGYSVLAVDYRLAPEAPFPAGLADCVTAYGWLRDNGPSGAQSTQQVVIAGDSAGGNLAVATWLRCQNQGLPSPAALLLLSPALDLSWGSPSITRRAQVDPLLDQTALPGITQLYVQNAAPLSHPEVSPLYGDLAHLPPTLIHVGDHEVLLDDSLRFVERAAAAGSVVKVKIWPDMIHVFQCFYPYLAEGQQSLQEMADFIAAVDQGRR